MAGVMPQGIFASRKARATRIPLAGLEGASNEAGGEKTCGPKGCAENGLGLRYSSVTEPGGYAPSSRLAPGHFGRNITPSICETHH
jgi:hypothetical protein